jgi:hypothetical protein
VSIRAAVLASAPDIYWPLDDTNSAIAADASGNSRPGIFYGAVALGAPGPDSGSTCLAASASVSGVQLQGNAPFTGFPIITIAAWFGETTLSSSGQVIVYYGNSSNSGFGLTLHGGDVWSLTGGVGTGTSGHTCAAGVWHMVAMTYSPGVHYEIWVDGVSVQGGAIGTYNTIVPGNPFLANSPNPGLLAHVALWHRMLVTADIAAIWAAGPGAVPVPPVSGRAATDADVLALETKLDTILASVRKAY